jgi:ribosome biogenesis GTPase
MTKTGLIIAHQGVKVLVRISADETVAYSIKRKSDLVVGDNVSIENDRPICLARKNVLKRRTPYGLQNMGANLDGVGIVIAEMPPASKLFLDQVIMTARKENISPFIVVNKSDLVRANEFANTVKHTFLNQVPIILVSATGQIGLEDLRAHVKALGRCVLLGVSGVGKSSLLNALVGGATQKTGATVDKDRHGAHTTSQAVLFTLDGGGELIDSPGLRDFSPPELLPKEVAHYFVGFAPFLTEPCHFSDCLHVSEPGCVIKAAVKTGKILQARYENYLELLTGSQKDPESRR